MLNIAIVQCIDNGSDDTLTASAADDDVIEVAIVASDMRDAADKTSRDPSVKVAVVTSAMIGSCIA